MQRVLAVVLVVWFGCAPTAPHAEDSTPTLRGTWRSSRALTLRELQAVQGIDAKQRKMLEGPTFFGELVLVIDGATITSVLPYHRASDRYRVLNSGRDFVTLESTDAKSGERQIVRCRFRDGQLLVPVSGLGFHEVFVRVTGSP